MHEKAREFLARAETIRDQLQNKSEKAPELPFTDDFPSELTVFRPTFTLESISGLNHVKQALKEWVIIRLKFPQLFQNYRARTEKVLLYGPNGCGKSHLASACAGECSLPLYSLSMNEIRDENRPDQMVRKVFTEAQRNSPAVVLIRDVGVLREREESERGTWKRQVLTELLVNLTSYGSTDGQLISVLMTCNTPWDLERPLLRRIDRQVYIPLPDALRRRSMLQQALPFLSETDHVVLADRTEGLSFHEIQAGIRKVATVPSLSELVSVFSSTPASTDSSALARFQSYVMEHSE